MQRFSVLAENLRPVEGHPFILIKENGYDGCKWISVLNVINRIHYIIFKNPTISVLVGSYHVQYNSSKEQISEAETLSSITSRLDFGVLSDVFNESTDAKGISKVLSAVQYIEDGFIKSVNTDGLSAFDVLKKHSTDKETIEVLDSVING